MAEAFLEEGKNDSALLALDYFKPGDLPSTVDRQRWYWVGGTALYRTGDRFGAYEFIREFVRQVHYYAPLADLLYRIGEDLAASKWSFWILVSDRIRAKTVLRDFVSHYPHDPHYCDAQYRLAEMAYEDGDYEQAKERFTKVFESPWKTKALFRVAMCHYRRLEGPEYDLEEMTLALKELTDFLAHKEIDNPRYRAEAEAARSKVRADMAAKQLSIAEFYRELGNGVGRRTHLDLAAVFTDTAAGTEAARQLATLPPPSPARKLGPPTGGPR